MKAVFLTESSYDIGLGHLRRCLSLACEFEKDKVFEIEFLLPEIYGKTRQILEEQNFVYNYATERLEFFLKLDKATLVLIVDTKTSFYDEFLEKMFEKSVQIFGIDDLSHRNILYTANFSPPAAVIPNTFEFEQKKKNYIGWKWVPIHKPSTRVAPFQEKRKENDTLLLFGGSDPEALSSLSLNHFGRNLAENNFILICGPLMKQSAIDECKQISRIYGNLEVIESPQNLSVLMYCSSYSVTTFGHTFYELIAHGNNPLGIYRNIDDVLGLFSTPDLFANNLVSIAQYRELMIENDPSTVTEFWNSKKKSLGSVDPSIQEVSNELMRGSINIKTMITNLI
jgi:UDP-2,4-diacetamido-2,4,6-trideoxy-beta-L-altropyranose hydrolase